MAMTISYELTFGMCIDLLTMKDMSNISQTKTIANDHFYLKKEGRDTRVQ